MVEAMGGATSPFTVSTPVPLVWEQVSVQLGLSSPAPGLQAAHARAELLARLRDAGWELDGDRVAHVRLDVEDAQTLAQIAGAEADGIPLHIVPVHEAGDDTLHGVVCGGLFAGREPHPQLFPATVLPAIVWNQLTGAQQIVVDVDELRRAVGGELEALASWWRAEPGRLSDLGWPDVPDELDALARQIAGARADVPWLAGVMPDGRGFLDRSRPRCLVEVLPVRSLLWGGTMLELSDPGAAAVAGVRLSVPEGLAANALHEGARLAQTFFADLRAANGPREPRGVSVRQ